MNFSKILSLFSKKEVPSGHKFFSGIYHGGDAEYVYVPSPDGEKHIFDGEFSFDLKVANGNHRKADGIFVMNKKEGNWIFVRKTPTSVMTLKAHFSAGHIVGNLEFTHEEMSIQEVDYVGLSMNISDGLVKGEIVGKLNSGDFHGFCDQDGYPDGDWTLETKETETILKEKWEHGRIVESCEISTASNRKSSYNPRFVEQINFILQSDCRRLLNIVGRGTENVILHIPRKTNNESCM